MMNLIQEFKIDESSTIKILIPNLKNKSNYYYKPTKKLHMFDEVTVVFEEGNKNVNLIIDNLNIVLHSLKDALEFTLNNKVLLPNDIKVGELGNHFNIYMNKKNSEDNVDIEKFNYSLFWLWSGIGIQTWLYNENGKIYLEITPNYPWLFLSPEELNNYTTFDEFMKTYTPITVKEIDHVIAKKWLEQCNDILNTMIKI